jgi:Rha family phage regulatory protein
MNTQVTPEIRPELTIIDGKIKTTSLKIAEHFGKRHERVMNAIRNLECSTEFNKHNFVLVEYKDAKGEKRPAYEITRDGFMFLAMGFTGAKAAQWKEAYITAFNRMEAELQGSPSQELPPPEPPTITKAQQGELYTRATRIAGGDKKKMAAIWSRLRTHYRINGYTNLPADQFQDALETLDRYKQEYNQGAEILHISTIELEAMLTERAQALPPPAKEGELLPNPTKDDLIGILTRQITALEAQLQAAQNLSPARMILALKQEGHLVIEKGQDLPGQIVMHYVSPKRLTQLIHCATDRLENFLREEVANA